MIMEKNNRLYDFSCRASQYGNRISLKRKIPTLGNCL